MNDPKGKASSLPLHILQETYRPLAFYVGEMLLAAAPFLPEISQVWARRLLHYSPPPGNETGGR